MKSYNSRCGAGIIHNIALIIFALLIVGILLLPFIGATLLVLFLVFWYWDWQERKKLQGKPFERYLKHRYGDAMRESSKVTHL